MNLPKQSGAQDSPARLLVRLPLPLRRESVELNHDFTLPDYLPEISKLLRVTLRVLPPESYAGAGTIELSGRLVYDMLYADADGQLHACSLPAEYGMTVRLEAPDGCDLSLGVDAWADPIPELTVTRVLSPRKLGIRTRMSCRARAFAFRSAEEELVGASGGRIERLTGSADTAVLLRAVGDPVELGDEILDGTREGEPLRVISSEGRVLVTEAIPEKDAVNLRGELYLKLLTVRGTERTPSVVMRKLPFTAEIPMDGADRYCDARGFGVPSRLDCAVEDGRIIVDAELILVAECQKNEQLLYTRDLFSTARETEVDTVTETLPFALLAENGNFTLSDTVALKDAGIASGDRILDVTGELNAESVTGDGGKAVITGTGRFLLLTENAESGELGFGEVTLPFRYVGDSAGLSGDLPAISDSDVSLAPISVRVKSDGEKLGIDAEIAVSYRTEGVREITRVSCARFGEPLKKPRSATVLAYPAPEETLWSVARRYRTELLPLAERNGIEPAPDAPVALRYLVVCE